MLTAAEQTAVSKAIAKAESPGEGAHAVDVLIRVKGTVTVGAEQTTKTYPKADPLAMLAVMLEGKSEDEIGEIVKAAKDAPKSEIERVKTAANDAAKKGRKPTLGKKNGQTRTDLTIERIENNAPALKLA